MKSSSSIGADRLASDGVETGKLIVVFKIVTTPHLVMVTGMGHYKSRQAEQARFENV